jgi:hypothetical protein
MRAAACRTYWFREYEVPYDGDDFAKELPKLCARMFAATKGLGTEPEHLWRFLQPEKSYAPFLLPPKDLVSVWCCQPPGLKTNMVGYVEHQTNMADWALDLCRASNKHG